MRKSTRLLTTLFASFELFGCGIDRPNIDACIVNGSLLHRRCYNVDKDYNDAGELKPDAKPTIRKNETVMDLNKMFCVDSQDGPEIALARLKAWIQELREECSSNKSAQKTRN